jgi:hypothetical protein
MRRLILPSDVADSLLIEGLTRGARTLLRDVQATAHTELTHPPDLEDAYGVDPYVLRLRSVGEADVRVIPCLIGHASRSLLSYSLRATNPKLRGAGPEHYPTTTFPPHKRVELELTPDGLGLPSMVYPPRWRPDHVQADVFAEGCALVLHTLVAEHADGTHTTIAHHHPLFGSGQPVVADPEADVVRYVALIENPHGAAVECRVTLVGPEPLSE